VTGGEIDNEERGGKGEGGLWEHETSGSVGWGKDRGEWGRRWWGEDGRKRGERNVRDVGRGRGGSKEEGDGSEGGERQVASAGQRKGGG